MKLCRRLWRRACLALLASGMIYCTAAARADNANSGPGKLKLEIPFNALSYDVAPMWVAVEGGLFQRYGIDAAVGPVVQSPALVASVLSGESPFAMSGPDAVIAADLGGCDIVILAAGPRVYFAVFANPRIKALRDLEGKKIGITQFGTTTDFITRYVLRQAHLAPDKDTTLLPMGLQQNVLAGLEAGAIDAAELAADSALAARRAAERGSLSLLADVFDYDLYFYSASLVARKSWIAAHPAETLDVLRAYLSGIARIYANKEATIAVIRKYAKLTDPDAQEDAYRMLLRVLQKDPMPHAGVLRTILDDSPRPGARSANPESFIDSSFLAALEREGFIDALYNH
jgi:NitT/TauT family transport system substrate-binding protein